MAAVPKGVGVAAVPKGVVVAAVPKGVGVAVVPKGVGVAVVPKGVVVAAVPKGVVVAAVPKGVGVAACIDNGFQYEHILVKLLNTARIMRGNLVLVELKILLSIIVVCGQVCTI